MKVEANETGSGVEVKAVYPRNVKGRFGRFGRFSRFRIPAGVRFDSTTVNGDVEAIALDNEIDAKTVNGSVRVSTSQAARAKTVNGRISATVDDRLSHPLELHSVNGRITVDAPAGIDADVEASTVHGGIKSDFPVTVKGKWGMHSMSGRLGEGGPKLAMKTVNGGIELCEAGQ